jgi:hypothetical protein
MRKYVQRHAISSQQSAYGLWQLADGFWVVGGSEKRCYAFWRFAG